MLKGQSVKVGGASLGCRKRKGKKMNWWIEVENKDCPFLGKNDECYQVKGKKEQARYNCVKRNCPIISNRSVGYHDVDGYYKE